MGNVVRLLKTEERKVGLQMNANKTKLMEFINSEENQEESEELIFEKIDDFKYLGAILSTKNNCAKNK